MTEIDNQQVTQHELGWLAGAFDADGSIYMHLYQYDGYKISRVELTFTNTCKAFLCKVLDICKRLGVGLHVREKTRAKSYWSPAWDIRTGKLTNIRRLLRPLIPMLTAKKERAELLYDFCDRRLEIARTLCDGNIMRSAREYPYTAEDLWYYEKFRELNKRVTPTTIPEGSRVQENPKRRAQVNRLTCDDMV